MRQPALSSNGSIRCFASELRMQCPTKYFATGEVTPDCLATTSRTLLRPLLMLGGGLGSIVPPEGGEEDLIDACKCFIEEARHSLELESLRQALDHWLHRLGWASIDADNSVEQSTFGLSESRIATAGQARLSVWLWHRHCSLDGPVLAADSWLDSPERLMERVLVERNERVGILLNASEFRVLLSDRDGASHFYSVLLKPPKTTTRECSTCNHHLIASWCGPQGAIRAEYTLVELRGYRKTLLGQLRRQLQQGAELFLTATIQMPANREALRVMGPRGPLATLLWQETVLFGFCILSAAIAETADLALDSPSIRTRGNSNSTLALLAQLESAKTTDWSLVVQHGLHAFGDDGGPFTQSAAAVAMILPPAPFRHLSKLLFDTTASRRLIESLLLLDPSGCAEQCSPTPTRSLPFVALAARDLADLFETMLCLCPGIARTTLYRHRCGKYDVISTRSTRSTANAPNDPTSPDVAPPRRRQSSRSRNNLEVIAPGNFYLYAGNERKNSGAFYTPRPLVEYLLDGTLSPVRLGAPETNPLSIDDVLSTRLLDPAMGAGAFLLGATRRLSDYLLAAAAAQYARCASTRDSLQHSLLDPSELESTCADVVRIPIVGPRLLRCLHTVATNAGDSARVWDEARALCRIAVVSVCIYGVDTNPLAVAVTRLFLSLDCHCADYGAVRLAQHLITGDSLIGPRIEQLFSLPHAGTSLNCAEDGALSHYLQTVFSSYLERTNVQESAVAQPKPPQADVLAAIVATWTGGVMLNKASSDRQYVELLTRLATGATLTSCFAANPALLDQCRVGETAVCFELRFPEIFAPRGLSGTALSGFSVVLGNPPWDAVKANSREVLAEFDPRAFDVKTRSERDELTCSLSRSPHIAARLKEYADGFARRKRAHDRQFLHQKLVIQGDLAGRHLDLFRLFIERSWQLLQPHGRLGLVVPSAFHTAAGAVGVRRLLLETGKLTDYVVFRNTQQLFDISRGFEFGLLLASKSPTSEYQVRVRSGLEQPADLLRSRAISHQKLAKSAILSGSPYANISVSDDEEATSIAARIRETGSSYSSWETRTGIRLRSTPTSVHRTHESPHFETVACASDPRRSTASVENILKYGALLHEGGTFHRYDDMWGPAPTFRLAARRVVEVERWRDSIGHFRIAMRAIVGSSAHKCIATLLPPGILVTNSALVEAAPGPRLSAYALATIAVLNSSVASWLFCAFADLNVNLFALRQLPWPERVPHEFLAHSAMRLCANHDQWEPLWREQLGDRWRESVPRFKFPALPLGTARTNLVATIDAVVATAYGLSRQQYQKVLSHFGADWQGTSFGACLGAFDAIGSTGAATFMQHNDPYADAAVVLTAPRATLELPQAGPA